MITRLAVLAHCLARIVALAAHALVTGWVALGCVGVVLGVAEAVREQLRRRARLARDVRLAVSRDMPAGLIARLQCEVNDAAKQMRKDGV